MGNAAFSEVENDVGLFVLRGLGVRSKCVVLVVTLCHSTCYIQSCAPITVGTFSAILAVGLGDEGVGRVCVEP